MGGIQELWKRISGEVKLQVNQANWSMFQTSVSPKLEGDQLVLEVVNDFCREWVEKRYRDLIQKSLQETNPALSCIFVTRPRANGNGGNQPYQMQLGEVSPVAGFQGKVVGKPPSHGRHDQTLNSKYSFETFIIGKSNQFAHAVCQAVCKAPGALYNPVFIYGGVGLGKTHLLQAVGHEMLRLNTKGKIAYLSSETFTNEFIDAIKDKKTNEFRAKYRKRDLLLLDDVQFFAGKERVVEEFFHTFNELFQNKKQIILTSDLPPKKLNNLEERLISRFEMGCVADVQAPELETRTAILKSCLENTHAKMNEDFLMYLAERVTNNIRELEGALNRVIAFSSVVQRPIDKELIDQVLKDMFRETSGSKITILHIQKKVAEFYDLSESEMTSKRRAASLVFPRQIAMRLTQLMTQSSLSQIGKEFGGRDHTTVMHACEKINRMLKEDASFAEEFERVKAYVKPRRG